MKKAEKPAWENWETSNVLSDEIMHRLRKSKKPACEAAEEFYDFILTLEFGYKAGYKAGLLDARKESLASSAELFKLLAHSRFPRVKLDEDLATVNDPNLLRQLAYELKTMPDAETLLRRLAQLVTEQQ